MPHALKYAAEKSNILTTGPMAAKKHIRPGFVCHYCRLPMKLSRFKNTMNTIVFCDTSCSHTLQRLLSVDTDHVRLI